MYLLGRSPGGCVSLDPPDNRRQLRPAGSRPRPDKLGDDALGDDIARRIPEKLVDGRPHVRMEEKAVRDAVQEVVLGGLAGIPERLEDPRRIEVQLVPVRHELLAQDRGLQAQPANRRGEEVVPGKDLGARQVDDLGRKLDLIHIHLLPYRIGGTGGLVVNPGLLHAIVQIIPAEKPVRCGTGNVWKTRQNA